MDSASELFTAPSRWMLVAKLSEELHALMRQYRRNRWWFVPNGQSPRKKAGRDKEGPQSAFPEWVLFRGQAGGLSGVIRANHYEQNRPPQISVEFRECPQTVGEKPPRAERPKRLVVRIGLIEEAKQGPTVTKMAKALANVFQGKFSVRQTQRVIRGQHVKSPQQRAMESNLPPKLLGRLDEHTRGDEEWYIHPQRTPLYYTQFVLLVYLMREDYLNSNQEEIRDFLREQVFRRWLHEFGAQTPHELDNLCLDILSQIAQRYSLPQRSNALNTYLRKTIRGMARQDVPMRAADLNLEQIDSGELVEKDARLFWRHTNQNKPDKVRQREAENKITVDHVAEVAGVRRETVYKWAREGKIPTNKQGGQYDFTQESIEKAKELTKTREKLAAVIHILVDHCGRTPGAARKLVERKKKKGMSLRDITQEAIEQRRTAKP